MESVLLTFRDVKKVVVPSVAAWKCVSVGILIVSRPESVRVLSCVTSILIEPRSLFGAILNSTVMFVSLGVFSIKALHDCFCP